MDRSINIESEIESEDYDLEMPQKANDVILEAMRQPPRPPMFDVFWQTGEVALLFGASGVGKSVLAVQIADALARGTSVEGFEMPKRHHKVLYVDMTLSKQQFQRRYMVATARGGAKPYKFAERFYRGCPPYDKDLCAWVRSMVRRGGFEVVVIDDLTAVMRTNDGTIDSLRIIRGLKRLSQETGVSVLVLADSYPSPKGTSEVAESDLRRSRVLCGVADSVFAIGRLERGDLKLVQFRSQGSEVVWGSTNPIGCMIRRRDNGLLGFSFDAHAARKLDPDQCYKIAFAGLFRSNGMKYREIAKVMHISKSHAERLVKAWTPAIRDEADRLDRLAAESRGEEFDDSDPDPDEFDEFLEDEDNQDEFEDDQDSPKEDFIDVTPVGEMSGSEPDRREPHWYELIDARTLPFASGIRPRHIHDLEFSVDPNGREVFVEKRADKTGKLKIWYRVDPKNGRVTRWENIRDGNIGTFIGTSGWI